MAEWVRCPVCGNKTRLQIRADKAAECKGSVAVLFGKHLTLTQRNSL